MTNTEIQAAEDMALKLVKALEGIKELQSAAPFGYTQSEWDRSRAGIMQQIACDVLWLERTAIAALKETRDAQT